MPKTLIFRQFLILISRATIVIGSALILGVSVFFSIHLLSFNVAIEALLAHHLQHLYLAKSHILFLRVTALFSLSAAILTLYAWVLQHPQ